MSRFWRKYVPVAQRQHKAKKSIEKLHKQGTQTQPVILDGRIIASSFWGKAWCDHLESFSDYENRLPRGRAYVRNGSVCHLEIKPGCIEALVAGSSLYRITIKIKSLKPAAWKSIKDQCRGQIGSMLELLQGKLSNHVMTVVSHRQNGLFPQPSEIELKCSCPDWANMCKHVAAVLYGVGSRLDTRPELLFLLRAVDASELIAAEVALPASTQASAEDALLDADLSGVFGIDLESGAEPVQMVEQAALPTSTPLHDKATRPTRKQKSALKTAKLLPAVSVEKKKTNRMQTGKVQLKKGKARTNAAAPPTTIFDPKAPTGSAITHLHRLSGLSEKEFARALGVSLASIHRWEATPGALRLYARPLRALSLLQEGILGE